jgi:hypothetical protein
MMLNWESMMSITVGPALREEQDRILAAVTELEVQWPEDASAVNEFQQSIQERLVERWWRLADDLIARYSDATYTRQNTTKMSLGYQAWWLQMIGYNQDFYQVQWVQPSLLPPRLLWDSLSWFRASMPTFLAADRDAIASIGLPLPLVSALIGAMVGAFIMHLTQRRQQKVSDLGQKLLQ